LYSRTGIGGWVPAWSHYRDPGVIANQRKEGQVGVVERIRPELNRAYKRGSVGKKTLKRKKTRCHRKRKGGGMRRTGGKKAVGAIARWGPKKELLTRGPGSGGKGSKNKPTIIIEKDRHSGQNRRIALGRLPLRGH